jgi:hypothetical protein
LKPLSSAKPLAASPRPEDVHALSSFFISPVKSTAKQPLSLLTTDQPVITSPELESATIVHEVLVDLALPPIALSPPPSLSPPKEVVPVEIPPYDPAGPDEEAPVPEQLRVPANQLSVIDTLASYLGMLTVVMPLARVQQQLSSPENPILPFHGRSSGYCTLPLKLQRDHGLSVCCAHKAQHCFRQFWPNWKLENTLRPLPLGTQIHFAYVAASPAFRPDGVDAAVAYSCGTIVQKEPLALRINADATVTFPMVSIKIVRLKIRQQAKPLLAASLPKQDRRLITAFARNGTPVKFKWNGKRCSGIITAEPGCRVSFVPPGERRTMSVDIADPRISNRWYIQRSVVPRIETHQTSLTALGAGMKTHVAVNVTSSANQSTVENKLSASKLGTRVATFNARSAARASHCRELLQFMKDRNLDILVINECRWIEVPYHFNHLHSVLNPAVDGNGGLAIISKRPLVDIKKHGTGCIMCKVDYGAKLWLRLVALYCPHSGNNNEKLDTFWRELTNECIDTFEDDHVRCKM